MTPQTPERTFDVHVCRTGYGHHTLRVQAANSEQAMARALEEAPNQVFSEHNADYSVEGILPVPDTAA